MIKKIFTLCVIASAFTSMSCTGKNAPASANQETPVETENVENAAPADEPKAVYKINTIDASVPGADVLKTISAQFKGSVVVIDFWATWCGPCRMLAPIVAELASEYDGKIVVGKCDVEENEDIAMEFGVRNIPTILFFKDGKLVDKFVGSAKKPVLVEKFQALL